MITLETSDIVKIGLAGLGAPIGQVHKVVSQGLYIL